MTGFVTKNPGGLRVINHPLHAVIGSISAFLNDCFFFVLKVIGILLLKIFYHAQAEQSGNIPARGPLIVAANHFSFMDPMVLQSLFPRRISFMMTEVYYEGRGKWLFKLLRCICVKEGGANIAALRGGLHELKKNEVLGIFPEGGISKEGCLREGNPGIGFLALKSGVPVIPAFISGTYEALPKGAKLIKTSKIRVRFGKPMTFKHTNKKSNKQGVGDITRQIMEQIERLSLSAKQTR